MSSVKKYKCLNCGAGLEFSPTNQNWKCHYCFSDFSIQEVEEAYNEGELPDEDAPELDSYSCNSCGAELIADDTISATFCLYCKNPTIIKNRFSGRFKPQLVIPFNLTKDDAQKIYTKWIKRRIFAPKKFKSKEEIDKVTGVYVPYWLFNCDIDGQIEGVGTKVRTWTSGDIIYTETRYYNVEREGNCSYNLLPVDGSKKLDDSIMEKVEPFDYSKMVKFSLPYMSGFMAEQYDVDSDEASRSMKKRVQEFYENRLKGTVKGYRSFKVKSRNINFNEIDEQYAMLPIYLLVNKHKGKDHVFVLNGQTGKVVGDTPIDRLRQFLFFGAFTLGTFLITLFGGALIV